MSKTSNSLPSWREIAVPHEDVQRGTFQQAEFAADLSRVHAGKATAEYQDAELFFARTYVTEGMRLLLGSVIERITGQGGDPVIQLQTAFGGGKTHTLLAVYHMAKGEVAAHTIDALKPVLREQGVKQLPAARVAVLDGIQLAPDQPAVMDGIKVNTLWGQLAWQLGGAKAYALVKESDHSGTSPGKDLLAEILHQHGPCIILIDELVAYVRQFEEGQRYKGGTYDSNLSFMQALMEAVRAVPNAVLLASLPESDKEAGGARGVQALRALEHYFQRLQAVWKAVSSEESFEIVRRRLFQGIQDQEAVREVCRAFAKYHQKEKDELPQEVRNERYTTSMEQAYPIHPELFERLYVDWSTLENFQRTRGVLKLMAKVIHRLWKDGNNDPLIMPGSFPLMDADTLNEVLYYLPQGWTPVIERDVDGERSETWEIENKDTRFGSVQACRRAARAIFLGSAPSTSSQGVRGVELERVILGVAQPGQQPNLFKDALRRLGDRLHYLNAANNRFWLDTRPNLRREMEERKRRFQDREDVFPSIRERVQKSFASSVFSSIHVFTSSGDVPDDWALRLVVLPPDAAFSKSGQSLAIERATDILKKRGDQPRFKQNRLIFVVADYDSVSRLKDHVRSHLAWRSIVGDYKDNRIVLDNLMAKQAQASLDQAEETVRRMIRETYKWLLAPMQEARPGKGLSDVKWEHFPLNPGAANWSQEIERVLKENELLISEWAPIHLAKVLKDWFWKDDAKDTSALNVWQQSCQQLYLPRLKDDTVFQTTMGAGAESREFFGFSQGKEPDGDKLRYVGFSYGKRTSLIMDSSLLLIEPNTAAAYMEALRAAEEASRATAADTGTGAATVVVTGDGHIPPRVEEFGRGGGQTGSDVASAKKRFYANIDLDPIQAKRQFADVVDEVVQQFTLRPGVRMRIAIEIQAESPTGFDDGLQRAVKENCNVLRFRNAEFEGGE
ncbi:MAG: ATP-binding protein [Planctomycetales bacterium]|nr:ATP-binding protein [Planctomycetales bacterium]